MVLSEKLQPLFDSIKAMPMSVAKDVDIPIRPFIQIAGRIIAAGERDTAELQKCKYDIKKIPDMKLHLELLQEISAHYDDIQLSLNGVKRSRGKANYGDLMKSCQLHFCFVRYSGFQPYLNNDLRDHPVCTVQVATRIFHGPLLP